MDDKFIAHNIVTFYSMSERMIVFSGAKKTFGGQILEVNISRMCQKAESISIQVEDSNMASNTIMIGKRKYDVTEWLKKEINGYSKNDTLPYYRVIKYFKVTSPLANLESAILGKEMDQSVMLKSKTCKPSVIFILSIIKMFNSIQAETNRYVAAVAKNVSFRDVDLEMPKIEIPKELQELMKKQ